MGDNNPPFQCPVCGFRGLVDPPRSPDGIASFEICRCCAFQFGFDDDSEGLSYQEYRQRWVANGSKWWSNEIAAPNGWNAAVQLASLPQAN
jgi:hypothetical protein